MDSMAGHMSTQVRISNQIILRDRCEHHDGVPAIGLLKVQCAEGSLQVSGTLTASGVPSQAGSPAHIALLPQGSAEVVCDEDIPCLLDLFTPPQVQKYDVCSFIRDLKQAWLDKSLPSGLKVLDVVLVGSAALGTALKNKSDLDICIVFNGGTHAEQFAALTGLAAEFVEDHPNFTLSCTNKFVTARVDSRGVFRLPRDAFAAALGGREAYQLVTIQEHKGKSIDLLPCIPISLVPRQYEPRMSLSANPGKVAFFQSLPDAVRQAAVLLKLWSCGAAANEVCRVYENAAERRWPVTDCKLKITGYPLSILAAAVCAANKDAGLDSHACRILADVLAILASQVSKPVLVLRNGTTTFADGGATAMQVFHQMGVRRQTVLGACILVQDAFYDHLFFKVGPMPLDKIRRQAASAFFRIANATDAGQSFRLCDILAAGSCEDEDTSMMSKRYSQVSGRMREFAGLTAKSVCPRRSHPLTRILLTRPSACHECETLVYGEEGVMYECPICPEYFQHRLCAQCKEGESATLLEPDAADLLRGHAGILDFAAWMLEELAQASGMVKAFDHH